MRPVPAVVRAHRQLVHQHPGAGLEQLHRQHPDHAEPAGDPQPQFGRGGSGARVQLRRRGGHLPADAAALLGLHHRPCRRLPGRAAGHQHRQLPAEIHPPLGQQPAVTAEPAGRRTVGGVRGRVNHQHALAVVPAARRLQHDRPARRVTEADHLRRVGDRGPTRAGQAGLAQPPPHHQLVLRVHQRGRTGPDRHAVRLQPGQDRGRDVLVVEREHVTSGGEVPDRVRVGVAAHRRVRDDLGGAGVRCLREHPQPDAERDRGRLHHPGQLPAADHPHHGEAAGPGGRCGHARRVSAAAVA